MGALAALAHRGGRRATASRRTTRPARAGGSPRSSRTCRTGTCAGPPSVLGPGRRGGDDVRAAFHTLHRASSAWPSCSPRSPRSSRRPCGATWPPVSDGAPDSVHLSDYPTSDERLVDPTLDDAIAAVRRIVELGRRVRTETKMRVRQPLLEAVVHFAGDHATLEPLLDLVAEELNVKQVLFAESRRPARALARQAELRSSAPARTQGQGRGDRRSKRDDGSLAARFALGESVRLDVGRQQATNRSSSRPATSTSSRRRSRAGGRERRRHHRRARARAHPELRAEGLARELVRAVQDARKAAGLDVRRLASCSVCVSRAAAEALGAHRGWIAAETAGRRRGRTGLHPGVTFEADLRDRRRSRSGSASGGLSRNRRDRLRRRSSR